MVTRAWVVGLVLASVPSCGGSDDAGLTGSNQPDPDASAESGAGTGGSAVGAGGGLANGGASASGGRSLAGGSASGGAGGAGQAADAGDGSAGTNTGGASEAGIGGSGGCASRTTYFADTDGDRFGDALSSVEACSRPEGHVENSEDCYDGNAAAKPGQTGWFTTERGDGSFDYDCDGSGSQHWPVTGACGQGGIGICTFTEGWQGAVPVCGGEAEYFLTCVGLAFCGSTTEKRTQDCH